MNPIPATQNDSGPLRVLFVATELFVGGEEMLLVDLIRRLDRDRFAPEICCLKQLGPLGEELAEEVPAHTGLLRNKFDVRVLGRLTKLLRDRRIDALVTVGTGGDKMFWGRLSAWRAGVKVVISAIHSTGYPCRVEWSNKVLAPLNDAFIALADHHAEHLIREEGCPADKVRIIANGVDTDRFRPRPLDTQLRQELGLPADAPVVGIVAQLRPEKNHTLWLNVASRVREQIPATRFLVVGDGPLRSEIEATAESLGMTPYVHFAGRRTDIPEMLSAMDLFLLTSLCEASPVSIMEAMAAGKPVVSTDVGSIRETLIEGKTGFLAASGDEELLTHLTSTISLP